MPALKYQYHQRKSVTFAAEVSSWKEGISEHKVHTSIPRAVKILVTITEKIME